MRLLLVSPALLLTLLLAACGSSPAVTDVDWTNYSSHWGESVRGAVQRGDCGAMFRAWEAAMGADDEALEGYLETAMEREDCPGW